MALEENKRTIYYAIHMRLQISFMTQQKYMFKIFDIPTFQIIGIFAVIQILEYIVIIF